MMHVFKHSQHQSLSINFLIAVFFISFVMFSTTHVNAQGAGKSEAQKIEALASLQGGIRIAEETMSDGITRQAKSFFAEPDRSIVIYTRQSFGEDGQPVMRDIYDRVLGIRFSEAAVWNPNHTLGIGFRGRPQAERLTLGPLKQLNMLESRGDRVMFDVIYQVSGEPAIVVMRGIIYADDPQWLYASLHLIDDRDVPLEIDSVGFSSMGSHGARHRGDGWSHVAGLKTDSPAPDLGAPMDLEEYALTVSYHRDAQGQAMRSGSVLLLLPDEVESLTQSRYSKGSVAAKIGPASHLNFAMSALPESADSSLQKVRDQAKARQYKLSQIHWQPQVISVIENMGLRGVKPGSEIATSLREIRQLDRRTRKQPLVTKESIELSNALDELRETADNHWQTQINDVLEVNE